MVFTRNLVVLFGLLASGEPALAADSNWSGQPYSYTVVNQDLRSVLERFGENIGVRVLVSDGVHGDVHGTTSAASAREFLDQLSRAYGFDWYYDGSVLSVSTVAEEQTETVPLGGVDFAQAQRKLTADGILDSRYTFRPGPGTGNAIVSGPPHYVTLVKQELGNAGPTSTPDEAKSDSGKIIIHDGDHVTTYGGPNYLPQ